MLRSPKCKQFPSFAKSFGVAQTTLAPKGERQLLQFAEDNTISSG
jgi:hypothetical protein